VFGDTLTGSLGDVDDYHHKSNKNSLYQGKNNIVMSTTLEKTFFHVHVSKQYQI
jgi:hypothetical protein